ncbi:MAG: signal peptidase II [Nakamurella multipartita]
MFNVADSAITIGGISLVITALLGIDFDGTRTRSRKDDKCLTYAGCRSPTGWPECASTPGWRACSG